MRHVITLFDLTPTEVHAILDLAGELKQKMIGGERPQLFPGHVLTQVFEKPSLRTRVSFEAAMIELGGNGIFLTHQEAGLNGREKLDDVARVISRYSDVVVLRTFSQESIGEFAQVASCPVINGLSDTNHPCQALTDYFTMQELFGSLTDQRLVYVGDGNNVAVSLAIAAAQLDLPITVCSPAGFELPEKFVKELKSKYPNADLTQLADPHQAVKDASVIYTDVWASMGQEAEKEKRQKVFADFQINAKLLASAPADCKVMHCLPARRGLEITDDVVDGPQSVVFQQAENRKHLAKGLIAWLLRQAQ